jgi:hypothetical protein
VAPPNPARHAAKSNHGGEKFHMLIVVSQPLVGEILNIATEYAKKWISQRGGKLGRPANRMGIIGLATNRGNTMSACEDAPNQYTSRQGKELKSGASRDAVMSM